jgi:alkylation response protein AidB-like acyl-CoA dehydrogenase
MPVAVNDDQSALAQTVAAFCERHGARESNRKDTLNHKAGERPDHWLELISLGLHAVHLSDDVGGQGGSIEDLAVVVGEAGRALLPGPLLPTVCASAIVSTAHIDDAVTGILKRLAGGTTATVLGADSSLRSLSAPAGCGSTA